MKARDFLLGFFLSCACAAIIFLSFLFVGKQKIGSQADYESENAILRRQCDSLQNVVNRLQNVTNLHLATIDSLKSLLTKNTHQTNENRISHEKEIVRISAMPADSLFLFFTEYVDGFNDSTIQ